MNKKILLLLGVVLVIAILLIAPKNELEQIDLSKIPYAGPQNDLSRVKVATVYEKVTDRESGGGRSLKNTVKMLKQTKTDLIFLGFYTWTIPAPDSPDNMPSELLDRIAEFAKTTTKNVPELVRELGYSYEELRKTIPEIKKEMPGVIFVGAIPSEALGRIEVDPIANTVINANDTWGMAFDPQKWNITYICPEDICKDYPSLRGKLLNKEGFQEYFALTNHLLKPGEKYDWQKAEGYYPDLTIPAFQELLVNRAKKQIDSGADAIFIDLLYIQAESLKVMVNNNENHQAVKDSYDAAGKIIDAIHEYGRSKGKNIYVGTWAEPVIYYNRQAPKLDFVTITPTPEEIYSGKFDEERWDKINSKVEEKFGKIPRLVFIDFGWANNSPMDVFSQMLDKKQQRDWLKKADAFFQSKDMIFMYPVHGGDFTPGAKRLSFGKSAKYDSLAPEFDTYETIIELANKKK
ncbi:MAG: hypothetical protein V1732_00820 [Patescibacteria group bacterium]